MIQNCFSQTNLTIKCFPHLFLSSHALKKKKKNRVKGTLKTNVNLIKQQDMTDGAQVPINTTLGVQ